MWASGLVSLTLVPGKVTESSWVPYKARAGQPGDQAQPAQVCERQVLLDWPDLLWQDNLFGGRGKGSECIYLDLGKAFHTTSHSILTNITIISFSFYLTFSVSFYTGMNLLRCFCWGFFFHSFIPSFFFPDHVLPLHFFFLLLFSLLFNRSACLSCSALALERKYPQSAAEISVSRNKTELQRTKRCSSQASQKRQFTGFHHRAFSKPDPLGM